MVVELERLESLVVRVAVAVVVMVLLAVRGLLYKEMRVELQPLLQRIPILVVAVVRVRWVLPR